MQRELTTARRIANLRIHVERAIGRIKTFKLFNEIPNNMAHVGDQVSFVCAFNPFFLCVIMTERNRYTYETCSMNNHGEKTSWDTGFKGA